MSEQDEQRVREIIREELQAAAAWVDALQCRRCAAHSPHKLCDNAEPSRIAAAIQGDE